MSTAIADMVFLSSFCFTHAKNQAMSITRIIVTLDGFARLQALGEGPEVTRRYLHFDVFARVRVKDALLLDIGLPRPARMAH
jgi:hypothetical protein